MARFKDGDLVCAIRQPANSPVDFKGEVGYVEIEETHHSYVTIHLLDVNGRGKGMVTVPTDCIENRGDSDLLDAKIVVAEKLKIPIEIVIEVIDMWNKKKPRNTHNR